MHSRDKTFSAGRVNGAGPKQQFFRTTPQDSFVPEGGRAIINCVIGDLGGRVQWTKDGLTLGKAKILHKVIRDAVKMKKLLMFRKCSQKGWEGTAKTSRHSQPSQLIK